MAHQEIREAKVKCPKCKNKKDFTLIEVWEGATINWEVINGKFDMQDGALEPGDAYKVEAKCDNCGHHWRIRGALQIGDITKD